MNSKNNIRNFVIISHIDHGKSTLADRFLEATKTIPDNKMRAQFLDRMNLEQEKGITIKMHPVQMNYDCQGESWVLHLIDTPGHVDFGYEVSRALAAVEGAVLLVDASQGIQAQTLANLRLAQEQNLVIIPAINKIDLAQAEVESARDELASIVGVSRDEVSLISAKKGIGISDLLERIIKEVPPPVNSDEFCGLIFDSHYDSFRGVIAYLRVFGGSIGIGDKFLLNATEGRGEVQELGIFQPDLVSKKTLSAGEIGYIATGLKESGLVRVGDTVTIFGKNKEMLPGYREPQPVVFNGLYVQHDKGFILLKSALEKLELNDPALTFEVEKREGLGKGYRVGFLGLLHAEITARRLEAEFNLDLVITVPMVSYRVKARGQEAHLINSTIDWPAPSELEWAEEPWVELKLVVPQNWLGQTMEALGQIEGKFVSQEYLQAGRFILKYQTPLRCMMSGFDDLLKSATEGHASVSYEIVDYRRADLVKLEILLAGEAKESLSKIVSRKESYREARRLVDRLKEILPGEQFTVIIQAQVEGRIIARQTIKARGKNVTAALYGGDWSRKKKLLVKQREGKKKLASVGRVKLTSDVFLKMLKS
jgi:GTP-binding protein LepA